MPKSPREIQRAVRDLQDLGRMPPAADISTAWMEKYQSAIGALRRPVTRDEVDILMSVLGNDDCFGLIWPLIHAIESSGNWPMIDLLAAHKGYGADLLRRRSAKAAVVAGGQWDRRPVPVDAGGDER